MGLRKKNRKSKIEIEGPFLKCKAQSCDFCQKNPPTSELVQQTLKCVFFYPTPSTTIQTSFKSYLQLKFECVLNGSSTSIESEPDAYCPSLIGTERIKCELCGNRQVFASKSMVMRHTLFCHSNAKRAVQAQGEHVCKFDGCFLAFPSYYQLNKHKKAENHQIKRGRK